MAKDQALLKNAQVDLEPLPGRSLRRIRSRSQQVDTQEALVASTREPASRPRRHDNARNCSSRIPRVTAPIGGRIGLRQIDPGNIVHASDANGPRRDHGASPISVLYPARFPRTTSPG